MNLKYTELEKQHFEILNKMHQLEEDYNKLDKEYKITVLERDKMKERLIRLKQRKFKHKVSFKI